MPIELTTESFWISHRPQVGEFAKQKYWDDQYKDPESAGARLQNLLMNPPVKTF